MAFLKGIDVSKYQTPSDWLPDGLTFIVARASIGLTADAQFPAHIAKAKAAGLMTGAYHFNWDDGTPEQQAQFLVRTAGDVDFLFLDVEGTKSFTPAQTQAFIAEVHRLGKKVGLYMSDSVYRVGMGQDYDWVARWSTAQPSSVAWEFWQYSDQGAATDGGRLDLDQTNQTLGQLRALSNLSYPETTMDLAFKTPKVALIPKGTRLYVSAALIAGSTDIIIDPARDMPVPGKMNNGALVVGYLDTTPTETELMPYYVKPAGIVLRDPVLEQKAVDQKVIDGLTSTSVAQQTTIASQATSISSLTGQLSDATTSLAGAQVQLATAEAQLGDTQAALDDAKAVAADAESKLTTTESALTSTTAERDALKTKSDADDAELAPARAFQKAFADFIGPIGS